MALCPIASAASSCSPSMSAWCSGSAIGRGSVCARAARRTAPTRPGLRSCSSPIPTSTRRTTRPASSSGRTSTRPTTPHRSAESDRDPLPARDASRTIVSTTQHGTVPVRWRLRPATAHGIRERRQWLRPDDPRHRSRPRWFTLRGHRPKGCRMTATLSRGTVKALRDQLAKRLADDPDDAEVIASEASEVIRKLHLALEHQLGTAELEDRDLLASEARNFAELRDSIATLQAIEKRAQTQSFRNRGLPDDFLEIVERNHEKTKRQLRSIAEDSASTDPEGFTVTSSSLEVRSEPQTYRPDRPHSYFVDMAKRSLFGDSEAAARLQRHSLEVAASPEMRAGSRTDGSGGEFVPPAWLISSYVPLARPGRVTADLFAKFALPPNTDSINIPKITTGTSVAAQTADNATVASQDIVTASVTAPVQTYAGSVDFALQLLEQSPIAFDQMIYTDLVRAQAQTIGAAVLTGTGANGQLEGLLTNADTSQITFTSASPTASGLYNAVAQAINAVVTNLYAMPDAVVMSPRRWLWLTEQVDTSGRPLVVPTAGGSQSVNSLAPAEALSLGEPVGMLQGLPVYLDALMPINLGAGTNEDRVIVGNFASAHLHESGVRTQVFFEPGAKNLTVTARLYSYVACTGAKRYPKAFSIIKGTGLAATL
ncbi:MAG: phage major capsid protein [Actinobacteria bacterium]|nr:phage major capsid protein [Actinomycetota bacterium]